MNINSILEVLNRSDYFEIDQKILGFSFDTRILKTGEVFCALHGEDGVDGHQYIPHALSKGAVVCLIDDEKYLTEKCILVPDVLKALELIAIYKRKITQAKVIAITGSCGKTTTKEMLRHALHGQGEIVFSKRSFNNHIGVPLSLTELKLETCFGVFEVGMNNPGEIAPLAEIIKPHIAIITTINESHIGHMNSMQAIVDEKAEIFSNLASDGYVILNHDNEFYDDLVTKAHAKGISNIISIGRHEKANVRLVDYQLQGDSALVTVEVFGKIIAFSLQYVGEHMALNSLFVLATCHILGCDMGIAISHLSKMVPVSGRCDIKNITLANGKKITLIDDAYNASPASMKAGLKLLCQLEVNSESKRYAVLGEMRELGEFSKNIHEKIGKFINKLPVDGVLCFGEESKPLFNTLDESKKTLSTNSYKELLDSFSGLLADGDIALIKGANGTKLWKMAGDLQKKTDQG